MARARPSPCTGAGSAVGHTCPDGGDGRGTWEAEVSVPPLQLPLFSRGDSVPRVTKQANPILPWQRHGWPCCPAQAGGISIC